jgi:hypothetical protein
MDKHAHAEMQQKPQVLSLARLLGCGCPASCHACARVQGLYPSFRAGTIYCSQVTANFIIGDLRIPAHCVRALPMDTPVTVEGVSVTLIDANHCPGAVLFLFRTKAPPHSEHPMQASVGHILLPCTVSVILVACELSGMRQRCPAMHGYTPTASCICRVAWHALLVVHSALGCTLARQGGVTDQAKDEASGNSGVR